MNLILTDLLQQKEKYISRAQMVLKKKRNWPEFRENRTTTNIDSFIAACNRYTNPV